MTRLEDEKVTLELDRYEYGVIFHSLNDKRNAMLRENRATDAVDDVLLKVIRLKEVALGDEEPGREGKRENRGKREKRGWRCHETR